MPTDLRKTLEELVRRRVKLLGTRDRVTRALNEVERDIEALKLVCEKFLGDDQTATEAPAARVTSQPVPVTDDPRYGAVRAAVEESLRSLPAEFTSSDVQSWLESERPESSFKRASVAGTLKRLCDEGKLEIITEGSGRRPATFRLSGAAA